MFATLRKEYQFTIAKVSKRKPTIVCWGEMAFRSNAFILHISGQPLEIVKHELEAAYKAHLSHGKVHMYSNSKTNAGTMLTTMTESILESNNISGDVSVLTGDAGIMMKMFLMAALCGKLVEAHHDPSRGGWCDL